MKQSKDWLKKIRIRWIIQAVLLVVIWTVMRSPVLGEWYARKIYPFFSAVLSRFSSLFPFSVGDCFIYGSVAGLLIYLVYAVVRRRSWKTTTGRMLEYLLWVYIWFYLAWGLNYFRMDFYARTQIPYAAYSEEDFRSFLTAYTDSLNKSYLSFEEIAPETVAEEVKKEYKEIAPFFALNQPGGHLRMKPMFISSLMSKVGVLGYMGPFLNEFNLNRDLLPVQYPFTYAHEMAHVLGIASEAEANLYGYLVCTGSDVPEIRFSGYFGLLPYVLSNAYQLLGEEGFNEWVQTISPEIKDLYNKKNTYWQALYSPFIGEIQDTVYNWFLKGNNIPTGRQNYSEVIGLLMALQNNEKNS